MSPSYTSLNFSSINSSYLQNIFPHLEFLRTRKRWESEGTEYGLRIGWGRTVHLSVVIDFCVFKLMCSLHCRAEVEFKQHFCEVERNEQLLHSLSVRSGVFTSLIIYVNVDYAREVV